MSVPGDVGTYNLVAKSWLWMIIMGYISYLLRFLVFDEHLVLLLSWAKAASRVSR
jgi:NADH:ubiquinone oxidoreductase subunit 3 (subunit A)